MNRETRRAARIAAAIAAGSVAIGWAARSSADTEAPAAAPATRGYVQLDVTAGADEATSLADTLRELTARLGLGLHVSTVVVTSAVGEGERARVRVTETGDRADIEIAEVRDGRLTTPATRTLPKNESSAIETEQIAHVVYAALESMFATDSEGAGTAAPAPASAPARAPEPAPARATADQGVGTASPVPLSVSATAFASGRGVASGTGPVLGAGGTLAVAAWHGVGRPALWLSGFYSAPFDERTSAVTVDTTITSLRAGASTAVIAARRFGLEVGLGAGADVLHTSQTSVDASVNLSPTLDVVDPVVTARVLAGVRLASWAHVVLGVDLDYDFGRHRYVTDATVDPTGGTSAPAVAVLDPWPFRPSLMVGLCVPLLDRRGCVE